MLKLNYDILYITVNCCFCIFLLLNLFVLCLVAAIGTRKVQIELVISQNYNRDCSSFAPDC